MSAPGNCVIEVPARFLTLRLGVGASFLLSIRGQHCVGETEAQRQAEV